MVPLITLGTLLEPQHLGPAVRSPRRISAVDLPKLAPLFSHAHPNGTGHPGAEKAADRIRAVLEGTHGTPIPQGSLFTADADGRIIAAIITTDRAFGERGTRTAFIAELFTHPEHRRNGLAEDLLTHAMQALHDSGHRTLAVTVNTNNAAAIAFYLSQDFRRFTHPAADD